jgi:subtilisin family serine protease
MTPAFSQLSRLWRLVALTGVLTLAVTGASVAAPAHRSTSAGGAIVVGYTSEAALRQAVARSGSQLIRRIPALHVAVVKTAPAALGVLDGVRGIRYTERPVVRQELIDPGVVPAPVFGGAYEWQYAASRENLVPAATADAASAITVAVIDTGADVTAPDLAAKAPTTWSVIWNTPDVSDVAGHGTFVASLAAGSPVNGDGIAGFGGGAKLIVVQAGDDFGQFTDVDEAAGIVYAVDHGAKVINMSFGGPSTSVTEQGAVDYAVSHGVLLVAAAGNSGLNGNAPSYPAALLQPLGSNGQGGVGLAVGATSIGGARASFSNFGSYISLAAPGENVFGAVSANSDPSAWPRQSLPGATLGEYGYASGTSFSSPEVAGAAAVVWGANPALHASDVAAILKQTAGGNGVWNQDTGYGLLDVASAVARAQGTSAALPSVTLTGSHAGRHVNLSWSAPGAVSYRLIVSRDGVAPQTLLGATASTSAGYDLDPGHTYSFRVFATDAYGYTVTSAPYAVSLPYSAVSLGLRASSPERNQHTFRLWGVFSPLDKRVGRGGRKLLLESFDGRVWHRFTEASTSSSGIAIWKLTLRRGRYRIRVRYPGAETLEPATSRALTIQVR